MANIPVKNSALSVDQLPLKSLMINIGVALAGSREIETWSQTNYGKSLSVFCGTDIENPPDKTDCPFVEIWADTDNHGRAIETHVRSIGIGLCLHDNDKTMVEVAKGFDIVRGANNLEELWTLVLTAAAGADLLDGFVAHVLAQRDENCLFPFFVINAGFVIHKPI